MGLGFRLVDGWLCSRSNSLPLNPYIRSLWRLSLSPRETLSPREREKKKEKEKNLIHFGQIVSRDTRVADALVHAHARTHARTHFTHQDLVPRIYLSNSDFEVITNHGALCNSKVADCLSVPLPSCQICAGARERDFAGVRLPASLHACLQQDG